MSIFDPTLLAPYFRFKTYVIASTSTGNSLLFLPSNAARVALIVTVQAGPVYIKPGIQLQSTDGIGMQTTTIPLILKFSDIGGVVGSEWYYSDQASISFQAVEVWYNPPGAK